MNKFILLLTITFCLTIFAYTVKISQVNELNEVHSTDNIKSIGTRVLSAPSGLSFKILLESKNFSQDEMEVALVTLPKGYRSVSHSHGSNELFYVIEGEMEHVVSGHKTILSEGDIGIAPKDTLVTHSVTSDVAVKTLVIWPSGGEVNMLLNLGLKEEVID